MVEVVMGWLIGIAFAIVGVLVAAVVVGFVGYFAALAFFVGVEAAKQLVE